MRVIAWKDANMERTLGTRLHAPQSIYSADLDSPAASRRYAVIGS